MSFKDILGQEKQKSVLSRSLERDRISHAYLFHGIRGIGKFETARVFARALNCLTLTGDACDGCSSCRKSMAGNHADITEIRPDGAFIKMAAIRELQHQIQFRPYEGKRRVFLIDEAERMNGPSANALLKTLEEPGPGNVLILVSSSPHGLPRTIPSRCQPLRFDPLGDDKISAFLASRHAIDSARADLIAAASGGSLEKALEMLQEGYHTRKNDLIARIAACLERKDPADFFSLPVLFGENRQEIIGKLHILETWYRDMLVTREKGPPGTLIHPDLADETESMSLKFSTRSILSAIDAVRRAREAVEQNGNRQLTLESMLFKLVAI